MKLFYISFADPDRPEGQQFLGACLLRALSFEDAIGTAHLVGCNPGGEAQGIEVPVDAPEPPASFIGRLLSREDIEEMDRIMLDGDSGGG